MLPTEPLALEDLLLPLAEGGDAGLQDKRSSACTATINLPAISVWGQCEEHFC